MSLHQREGVSAQQNVNYSEFAAELAALPFLTRGMNGRKRKRALHDFIVGHSLVLKKFGTKSEEGVPGVVRSNVSSVLDGKVALALLNNGHDTDTLLGELFPNFDSESDDDISYLLSIPKVREMYSQEYEKRKSNIELLYMGNRGIRKSGVTKIDATIEELEKRILAYKMDAFRKNLPVNSLKLSKIRSVIKALEEEKNTILARCEPATAYELERVMQYRDQFEKTGFIITPSRQKIIDEVIEKMILGENVLLAGSTGGGKTVLARKLIEILSDLDNRVVLLNAEGLRAEIESNPEFKEFLISGNSALRVSDFIGKLILKEGEKGATVTGFETGKLLRAWEEGKIPIFDEMDLAPNDILMRVKHLFTLRPGEKYYPQEDGDTEVKLQTTGMIATANIKGEKHAEREELDNAILRLFHMINISHMPPDEMVEMSKAILADPAGFIKGVGPEELSHGKKDWDEYKQASILHFLIEAAIDIQQNYLGKSPIATSSGSKKSLKKAIFEMGNFISILKGFKYIAGSKVYGEMDFNAYVRRRVVEFITRPGYPKEDRIILIKIFSAKGLVSLEDIPLLLERMEDISEDELNKEMLDAKIIFMKSEIPFIDPYELANIDPYNVRRLKEKELSEGNFLMKNLFRSVLKDVMEMRGSIGSDVSKKQFFDLARDAIEKMLEAFSEAKEYIPTVKDGRNIIGPLYELGLTHSIKVLFQSDFPGVRDGVEQLSIRERVANEVGIACEIMGIAVGGLTNEPEANTNTLTSRASDTQARETDILFEDANTAFLALKNSIVLERTAFVERLKRDGKIVVEGGEINSNLTREQIDLIAKIRLSDVTLKKAEFLNLLHAGYAEEIYKLTIEICGIEFMAFTLPRSLKGKKFGETIIGRQLEAHKDENWFVGGDFLDTPIGKNFLIVSKGNMRKFGKPWTRIQLQNSSESTDIVRECAKLGYNSNLITQSILLTEIIAGALGDEYVNFEGYEADSDQDGHEAIRAKILEIDKTTGLTFADYTESYWIVRNFGVYVDREGDVSGVVRSHRSDDGAAAGVCSFCLDGYADASASAIGFRPSL